MELTSAGHHALKQGQTQEALHHFRGSEETEGSQVSSECYSFPDLQGHAGQVDTVAARLSRSSSGLTPEHYFVVQLYSDNKALT